MILVVFAHIEMTAGFPEDTVPLVGRPRGVGTGRREGGTRRDRRVTRQDVDEDELPFAPFIEIATRRARVRRLRCIGTREGQRIVGFEILSGEIRRVTSVSEDKGISSAERPSVDGERLKSASVSNGRGSAGSWAFCR